MLLFELHKFVQGEQKIFFLSIKDSDCERKLSFKM